METTPPDRELSMEWTAVSQKRHVGQPVKELKVVSMDSRGKDPCWMFVVELGDYRTEPEILAELHLRYPWVKLCRRNGVSSNAHLMARTRDHELYWQDFYPSMGKQVLFFP